MQNQQVICIDFGSAYTKVAIRADWNGAGKLLRDLPLAPQDTSFCIPSVVARVERESGEEWAVGQPAAAQVSGAGVTIYQHLKAKLLSEQAAKDLATSAKHETCEYDEVGVVFFRKLKETLCKMSLPVKVDDCPVRLCIPKFEKIAETQQRMLRILDKAGWQPAVNRPTLYEPESNACGILTHGRNWTWHPRDGNRKCISNVGMFDRDIFGAFHEGALKGDLGAYGVLVIDIGAFTTDFGYVEFNNLNDSSSPPIVIQISQEIGVRELDIAVQQLLPEGVQQEISRRPISAWESEKRLFYDGKAVAFRNPKGGMVTIGQGTEAETIANAIKEFASRVVEAMSQFCRVYVNGHVAAAVLTGGGAMITLVRETLVNAMKAKQGTHVYDLLDENEPLVVCPPQTRGRRVGSNYYNPQEWDFRLRQNQDLMRGASAIGGCSVFFE